MILWTGPLTGLIVATLLHEAGHATAGILFGCAPRRIRVGLGPCLGRMTFGVTEIQLCGLPMSGSTGFLADDLERARAPTRCAIALAGPIANLLTACIGLVLAPASGGPLSWLVLFSFLFGAWGLAPAPGLDGMDAAISAVAWIRQRPWRWESQRRSRGGTTSWKWALWAACVPWFALTYGAFLRLAA